MIYTTVQGDMWDKIADRTLGDVAHTNKLMLANQKHIGTHIFPSGIVLNIPEVSTPTADSLPPWKKVGG
ncbi:MAG: phage tail protein [Ruminococcaceae bacterium]|nr:phage tail protein [Oscillospiraceae bacterium]